MTTRSQSAIKARIMGAHHDRALQHNPRESAQYIADMILELRNIAKSEQFGTLQGLLEIAYYEAFTTAHKVEIPEGELEHIASLSSDVGKS